MCDKGFTCAKGGDGHKVAHPSSLGYLSGDFAEDSKIEGAVRIGAELLGKPKCATELEVSSNECCHGQILTVDEVVVNPLPQVAVTRQGVR